ncbi:MAG: hypothetical protein IT449_10780 [Phycisphaerales bacterium]|nr:hypothetical protein [Phycisphaerales bacterium]
MRNLLLVPSFFFVESVVERRKPLGPAARRAGWVGCNILLSAIPPEGKLHLVTDGFVHSVRSVRAQYDRTRPLSGLSAAVRGWTLDVLRVVHQLGRERFTLQDVYGFEAELQRLHPRNVNIRPKLRQQLQVLRDLGFLRFSRRGSYELSYAQQP